MHSEYQLLAKTKSKNYKYYTLKDNQQKIFAKQLIINDDNHLKMMENEIEKYNILKEYKIIPQIISYDLKENKIIMYEYIEGKNLEERNIITIKEKIEILIKICNLINIMHQNSIVHCDLKPSNIMVTNEEIKIIDLGNSKFIGEINDYGSLVYTSLDQILRKKVSVYFDIYSLGIIIYKLLKRETPFTDRTKDEIIDLKKSGFIPQLFNIKSPNLNIALNNIIQKALTLNENIRYKNITEIKQDLIALKKLI